MIKIKTFRTKRMSTYNATEQDVYDELANQISNIIPDDKIISVIPSIDVEGMVQMIGFAVVTYKN